MTKTSFTLKEVRQLMYQAFKQGQGGESEFTEPYFGSGQKIGKLATQNLRFNSLRKLFPKIFGPHPTTAAAQVRRELDALPKLMLA
jgi:hypothetical protein